MAIADRIAVMNGGVVVQTGAAEHLYARPATAFVAEFVGRINLLPARASAVTADGAPTVELAGHAFRLAADPAARPVQPGQAVRVAVRPEAIELAPAASDHDSAVVTACVFLGEKAEYTVSWGDVSLHVCAYDPVGRGAFVAGDRVDVKIPEAAIRLLADEIPA